jgi:hypothetical protein
MAKISRREFLGRSAAGTMTAATAVTGLASPGRAAGRRPAPSDPIRVGLIGCGGQGRSDLSAFLKLPEIDCPIVADVDGRHLAEGVRLVEAARGAAPAGVRDFRTILDREDINAVIVAAPDHWHVR